MLIFQASVTWKFYHHEAEPESKELKNTKKTKRKTRNLRKWELGKYTGFEVRYKQSLQCCADAILYSCITNEWKSGKEKAKSSKKKTRIQSH